MSTYKIRNKKHFWSRVIITPNCWEWTGVKIGSYGRYGRPHKMAHRVAYYLLRGEIPEGLVIDHLCRNRSCVNPDHLELVTPRENALRGISFVAIHAQKTHCPRGHEFNNENTYNRPGKIHRECRICMRVRNRDYMRRKRAKTL